MLVKPTYKQNWEIPGGTVEPGEYPSQTCQREVREELGIAVVPGRLLGVDWVPARSTRPPLISYVFDGGALSPEQLGAVRPQSNEISDYRFCAPDEVGDFLVDRLARRVAICAAAAEEGETVYLEYGHRRPTASG